MKYLAQAIVIDPFFTVVEAKHEHEARDLALRELGRKLRHYSIIHSEITREPGSDQWHVRFEVEIYVSGVGTSQEEAESEREHSYQHARFIHPSVMNSGIEYYPDED